jgi:hypothetical protein
MKPTVSEHYTWLTISMTFTMRTETKHNLIHDAYYLTNAAPWFYAKENFAKGIECRWLLNISFLFTL